MSIVESGNQVKSQSQALSSVTVGAAKNPEPLEPPNDMLHVHAFPRQLLVFLLLLLGERMMLALFVGRA